MGTTAVVGEPLGDVVVIPGPYPLEVCPAIELFCCRLRHACLLLSCTSTCARNNGPRMNATTASTAASKRREGRDPAAGAVRKAVATRGARRAGPCSHAHTHAAHARPARQHSSAAIVAGSAGWMNSRGGHHCVSTCALSCEIKLSSLAAWMLRHGCLNVVQ